MLRSLLVSVLALLPLVVGGCSGSAPATEPAPEDSAPPVVARYADTTITLADFESAYRSANSRPSPSADSLEAYRDFLEQYLNYRLKVRAARDAGLDTLTSVRREIRSYRHQLARPRLMREHVYEPLARTLYERRQQEVDVSHILLRVEPDAPPADTLAAYREMQRIADSLRRGVPFGDLAYRNSDAPPAQRRGERGYRGRLGYVRAGQMVEPFEDRMYSVPPDSASGIFRTRFGYHLLKVHDRRPAQPPVQLSHIMLRPNRDSATAHRLLDSLRTVLRRGRAEFSELAETHSEDRRTAAKGGSLGTLESLRGLPPSFRDAVGALDSVGAVSPVVKTRYGYHLIELTDREELPSFEEAYDDLKEQVTGQPRAERRRTQFARRVRAEAGVRVDTARLLRRAPVSSLDTLARPLLSVVDEPPAPGVPVASLGDSTYTLVQVARHVTQTDGGTEMTAGAVLQDFLDEKALRYAEARLARRDAEFAAQMKEYRHGLLAFQFMQDSIWTPARRDTSGLRATYEEQREAYRFPERIRSLVLRAPADSVLAPYASSSGSSPPASRLEAARGDSLVTVDTMMVSDRSAEVYRRVQTVSDGTLLGPLRAEGRPVLLYRDTRLPPRPKTFEEARSSVVRDHQDRYEDRVLQRLRRRYDAETHPDRLRRAFDPS